MAGRNILTRFIEREGCRIDVATFTGEAPHPRDVFACLIATFRDHPDLAKLLFEFGDYRFDEQADEDYVEVSRPTLEEVERALGDIEGGVQRLNWGEHDDEYAPQDRSDGSAVFIGADIGTQRSAELKIVTDPEDPLVTPEVLIAGLIQRFGAAA